MHTPWIGPRRLAVIPAAVQEPSLFSPPPADWVDQISRRIFFDPDVQGIDRSLRAYIHAISYGKASLEADVLAPVAVPWTHCGAAQDAAIQQTPSAHAYEYACVVFTSGPHPCAGWAFYDNPPFPFQPARPGANNLRNWCYVSMDAGLGTWGMEIMHAMTAFGDLYLTSDHPGDFDNMACACGTHPSAYTKLSLGWLDLGAVATARGLRSDFSLHALALLQPPPAGRVAAIRIPSQAPGRYFLVEARLGVDSYERRTAGVSNGVPSEGVVVYEIDEAAWPPVHLRTPTALAAGQTYSNPSGQFEIHVAAALPGGFAVSLRSTENARCPELRATMAELAAEIRDLQAELQTAPTPAKAGIVARIRAAQAQRNRAGREARALGCALP